MNCLIEFGPYLIGCTQDFYTMDLWHLGTWALMVVIAIGVWLRR